ncbi:MAG TPA: hypothetical protein VFO89_10690, partial [Thermoanaerobaculia bacterium]|nr:hypothetical protein [Thermoanaerobaculia bacterium]
MAYTIAALEAELPSPEMNALVTEILASSLASVGLFRGGARTLADLHLEKPPAPYYERWLARTISFLEEQGLLRHDLTFAREVRPLAELWGEWETKVSAWANNPNQQAQGGLLKACLEGLPAILTGRVRATEVMFPNSS